MVVADPQLYMLFNEMLAEVPAKYKNDLPGTPRFETSRRCSTLSTPY